MEGAPETNEEAGNIAADILAVAEVPMRIKAAMALKGWRVAHLGRASKLDPAYLGQLVAGTYKNPGVLTLARIAAALEVPLAWLVTGRDSSADPGITQALDQALAANPPRHQRGRKRRSTETTPPGGNEGTDAALDQQH